MSDEKSIILKEVTVDAKPLQRDGYRTTQEVRNHALALAEDALNVLGMVARGEIVGRNVPNERGVMTLVEATPAYLNALTNAAGKIIDIARNPIKVEEDVFKGRTQEEIDAMVSQALEVVRKEREQRNQAESH